jgi:hypothetical protein
MTPEQFAFVKDILLWLRFLAFVGVCFIGMLTLRFTILDKR